MEGGATVDLEKRIKATWEALAEYGIYTEEDLDNALKTMKPLNIGCMVSPLKEKPINEELQVAK